jgi:hypothetical protein
MAQLEENVFNKGYAEVLIAEQHDSDSSSAPVAVGMALVSTPASPTCLLSMS